MMLGELVFSLYQFNVAMIYSPSKLRLGIARKLLGTANCVHVANLPTLGQNWKFGITPISEWDSSCAV